mmetsp:Transcript_8664/g.12909  ORF Transcript_8664/g.12909 Transcript_8664/m.12909 type:complete len:143 (-) Transcript_8664:266-694(-)
MLRVTLAMLLLAVLCSAMVGNSAHLRNNRHKAANRAHSHPKQHHHQHHHHHHQHQHQHQHHPVPAVEEEVDSSLMEAAPAATNAHASAHGGVGAKLVYTHLHLTYVSFALIISGVCLFGVLSGCLICAARNKNKKNEIGAIH